MTGRPLLLFLRSVCLSFLRSLAESLTNEILPEVDGRRVRGARPLLVCLLPSLTSLKRPADFFHPRSFFFFFATPSLHSIPPSISTFFPFKMEAIITHRELFWGVWKREIGRRSRNRGGQGHPDRLSSKKWVWNEKKNNKTKQKNNSFSN